MAAELVQYCVYRNPRDFPGKYVVRRWTITAGAFAPAAVPLAVVDTLEAARAAIPAGLHFLPRYPADDPTIAEVWM